MAVLCHLQKTSHDKASRPLGTTNIRKHTNPNHKDYGSGTDQKEHGSNSLALFLITQKLHLHPYHIPLMQQDQQVYLLNLLKGAKACLGASNFVMFYLQKVKESWGQTED